MELEGGMWPVRLDQVTVVTTTRVKRSTHVMLSVACCLVPREHLAHGHLLAFFTVCVELLLA